MKDTTRTESLKKPTFLRKSREQISTFIIAVNSAGPIKEGDLL